MNCSAVTIHKATEIIALDDGAWYLLSAEDQLYLDSERLIRAEQPSIKKLASSQALDQTNLLWWDLQASANAGEQITAMLNLVGPALTSQIVLETNSVLEILPTWELNPGGKKITGTVQGQSLVLDLPDLQAGHYSLIGTILPLLPRQAEEVTLVACWNDQQARGSFYVQREWFDFEQSQTLHFKGAARVVLPNGQLRCLGDREIIKVQSSSLDVLLALNDLGKPIWLATPLGETELVTLASDEDPTEYFVPILLYDKGWNWRVISKSGPWAVDLSPDQQLFSAQLGRVNVWGGAGEISLGFTPSKPEQAGKWLWWEDSQAWQGLWQGERLAYSLKLPKKAKAAKVAPIWALSLQTGPWFCHLEPTDFVLSQQTTHFSWGLKLATKQFWFESAEQNYRLELKPEELKVKYRPRSDLCYELAMGAANWRLNVEGKDWEAYLSQKGGGFRLKLPHSRAKWRLITLASCELTEAAFLAEVEQRVGYAITPQLIPYCTITSSLSYRGELGKVKRDLHWAAGVIWQPFPQVYSELAWSGQQGWQIRAGFVFPFVSSHQH